MMGIEPITNVQTSIFKSQNYALPPGDNYTL